MQDNNIDVFISDAEIEYFELSKPISDQTWDEFVRERKAISLEFSRKFNLNLVLSEPTIVSLIDSIANLLACEGQNLSGGILASKRMRDPDLM